MIQHIEIDYNSIYSLEKLHYSCVTEQITGVLRKFWKKNPIALLTRKNQKKENKKICTRAGKYLCILIYIYTHISIFFNDSYSRIL